MTFFESLLLLLLAAMLAGAGVIVALIPGTLKPCPSQGEFFGSLCGLFRV